jgi:CDP-diacylglycerol pyrophosphatase
MTMRAALLIVAFALIGALPAARAQQPEQGYAPGLGNAVDQCQAKGRGCELHIDDGYAIVKSICFGSNRYLLVALDSGLHGIEDVDDAKFAATAALFWRHAWDARHWVTATPAPDPRMVFGLAINSVRGRSQGRLHIHIDRVRADVLKGIAAALQAEPHRLALRGQTFDVRVIGAAQLEHVFQLTRTADRARQSIAVIAAGPDRFYLLTDAQDDGAHAESALRDCL